ncbi:MAG: hypothetical protein ACJAWQ_001667 [Paraglaciecola sp.]
MGSFILRCVIRSKPIIIFGNFRIYGPVLARLVSAAYHHHANVNTAAATVLVDALLSNISRLSLSNHHKALLVFAKGEHKDAKYYVEISIFDIFKALFNYLVKVCICISFRQSRNCLWSFTHGCGLYPNNDVESCITGFLGEIGFAYECLVIIFRPRPWDRR